MSPRKPRHPLPDPVGEGTAGKVAVAWAIRNRVFYGKTNHSGCEGTLALPENVPVQLL